MLAPLGPRTRANTVPTTAGGAGDAGILRSCQPIPSSQASVPAAQLPQVGGGTQRLLPGQSHSRVLPKNLSTRNSGVLNALQRDGPWRAARSTARLSRGPRHEPWATTNARTPERPNASVIAPLRTSIGSMPARCRLRPPNAARSLLLSAPDRRWPAALLRGPEQPALPPPGNPPLSRARSQLLPHRVKQNELPGREASQGARRKSTNKNGYYSRH
jgi:hypothetical protein